MARAVGIDLGTTNSVVTVLEGGEPTVIANSEGSRTTPSVVAFAKNGEVLVGQSAKNQAVTNVDRTIRQRQARTWAPTGRPARSTARSTRRRRSARASCRSSSGTPRPTWASRSPTPSSPSRPTSRTRSARPPRRPVRSRASTSCASSTSRPRPRWPTAWTRARPSRRSSSSTSVVARSTSRCSRSATASSRSRPPPVTTTSVVTTGTSGSSSTWCKTFNAQNGIDLSKDKLAMQRLREAAEKAKIELSGAQSTNINLPYITAGAEGPLHLDVTITRAEFQRMTQDLLDRTRAPFNQAIRDAGISRRPDRPRRPRRWLDPHAGRHRPGARADRRQGAQQGRQPGRGRRHRCRAAGRCPPRRGQGRPAPRRHPAVPGHRDQGRDHDQAHRAQHHDPDQALARSSRRPTTTSRPCRSRSSRASARWRPTTRSSACSS